MKNIKYEVLIASAILLLVVSIPFLQVQMVAGKKHHSDDESSDVSSDSKTGPPASSKSLFMLEIEKFMSSKVYFAEGSR
jgi:hypothetical protein